MRDVTILIVTKNRPEEIVACVAAARRITGVLEILVIDDGSDSPVRDSLTIQPDLRIYRGRQSRGLIQARNIGMRLARGQIVISIDDDAEVTDPDMADLVRAAFAGNRRYGAVTLPYVDIRYSNEVRQLPPAADEPCIAGEFRGTAFAIRRDAFFECGGFMGLLWRQWEESFWCARAYSRDWMVGMCVCAPIIHYESPRRIRTERVVYQMRNALIYVWHVVPLPWALIRGPGTIVMHFWVYGRSREFCAALVAGIGKFIRIWPRIRRQPMRASTYVKYRWLQRRGTMTLREFETRNEA